MKDLGKKPLDAAMPIPLNERGAEKWYPQVNVDAQDFPALKSHPIGKDKHVRMKVRKIGEHIHKGPDGRQSHKMDLELRGMEEEKNEPKSIEAARRKIMSNQKEEQDDL